VSISSSETKQTTSESGTATILQLSNSEQKEVAAIPHKKRARKSSKKEIVISATPDYAGFRSSVPLKKVSDCSPPAFLALLI